MRRSIKFFSRNQPKLYFRLKREDAHYRTVTLSNWQKQLLVLNKSVIWNKYRWNEYHFTYILFYQLLVVFDKKAVRKNFVIFLGKHLEYGNILRSHICVQTERKVSNTELFMVRTFLYLDWTHENTYWK